MTPKRKAAVTTAHDEAAPPSSLPQLCSEAADHVARARYALFDESYDADRALAHLDDAILCLKRLFAHGRTASERGSNGNGSRPGLRSA